MAKQYFPKMLFHNVNIHIIHESYKIRSIKRINVRA